MCASYFAQFNHMLVLLVRPSYSISSQLEVITSVKWSELKPESGSGLSNWIKGAVGKNDRTDWLEKLHFMLSTSPMWDRYILFFLLCLSLLKKSLIVNYVPMHSSWIDNFLLWYSKIQKRGSTGDH